MTWFLCVYFFTGSNWIAGDTLDGWGCREMINHEHCLVRQHQGNLRPSPLSEYPQISFECELK